MAHNGTVFAQVLKLVPRHEFESLARKHKSGRMSRSMTRWGQFVAMGMAQLTGRCSLRDIVSNLAAQSCKLYHLGVGVVTRSSLYDLRHSYGTALYSVAGDTRLVRDVLGHSDTRMTERYTLGHVPEAMRLATSRLEEQLGAPGAPTAPRKRAAAGAES